MDKTLGNFGNIHFEEAAARSPSKLANLFKGLSKYKRKPAIVENWHELAKNFINKMRILIKIKVRLLRYWKAVIILKELRKPSDIFLRFCLKTEVDLMFWEKFLIYSRISEWKIAFFTHFLSHDLIHGHRDIGADPLRGLSFDPLDGKILSKKIHEKWRFYTTPSWPPKP